MSHFLIDLHKLHLFLSDHIINNRMRLARISQRNMGNVAALVCEHEGVVAVISQLNRRSMGLSDTLTMYLKLRVSNTETHIPLKAH